MFSLHKVTIVMWTHEWTSKFMVGYLSLPTHLSCFTNMEVASNPYKGVVEKFWFQHVLRDLDCIQFNQDSGFTLCVVWTAEFFKLLCLLSTTKRPGTTWQNGLCGSWVEGASWCILHMRAEQLPNRMHGRELCHSSGSRSQDPDIDLSLRTALRTAPHPLHILTPPSATAPLVGAVAH